MGSIPLPSLDIRPPENPLDQYAKALSVKSMIGAQTTQQQQQQLQAQEIEKGQQDINDRKATTAAMQEWDGKSYDDLLPLVIKHGGSSNAVVGLKNSILGQQEKKSIIAKNDAETGSKNLETQQSKNDMLLGHLNSATSVPDDELIDQVKTEKNSALMGGYLDQQHADMLDQLIATGDPKKIRGALDIFEKGLKGEKEQFEQAYKERDLASKEWKEFGNLGALVNTRTGEVKAVGGGVLPMTPGMMESKYVGIQQKKAMGEKPSPEDAAFAKGYEKMKELVPAFNFNLQAAGVSGSNNPPAGPGGVPLSYEDQIKSFGGKGGVVNAIIQGNQKPPASFAQKSPYWQDVMQKVYAIDPQFNEQRAELRKAYTVGSQSKEINAINTAMGHVGVLNGAIDALNNGDIRALNAIGNRLGIETGNDKVTAFNTIVHRVGPEISKAYLGAGGSAGERGADEKDFDPNLGPQQLKTNVGITAQLLRSKISALENQWNQNKAPSQKSFQDQFIMPEAKNQLNKLNPPKTISLSQVEKAAKDHGVSVDEAKRQAQQAGYTIQ